MATAKGTKRQARRPRDKACRGALCHKRKTLGSGVHRRSRSVGFVLCRTDAGIEILTTHGTIDQLEKFSAFQAVVELKGLLKNAPDLNQDIKDIGQETKGIHDDVIRLQERMELLDHFPEKILIQLENIQKQLRTTPGVKP
jgi:hypothetical protein